MIKKIGKTALFAILFLAVWNGLGYLLIYRRES